MHAWRRDDIHVVDVMIYKAQAPWWYAKPYGLDKKISKAFCFGNFWVELEGVAPLGFNLHLIINTDQIDFSILITTCFALYDIYADTVKRNDAAALGG